MSHACIYISLLKRKGYFNNGLATGVASDMFHTAAVIIGNNVLLIVVPYMAIIVWRDCVTCRRSVETVKQKP